MSTEDAYDDTLIKVSGRTNAKSLASVIAQSVMAGHEPTVRAVGAGAVNQAGKACAIAAGYVAPRGIMLHYVIGFDDIPGNDGKPISALTFRPIRT